MYLWPWAGCVQIGGFSDGSSTDNITDAIGTSFGSFRVSASAMPAPTAPPTASPSPLADAPAPEASDTGLDSTTVVIIVVGTIVFLLVTLNLVFFFMYKRDDSANADLTTASGRKASLVRDLNRTSLRDLNGIANASLPRNPHFYPGTPEPSDGYSISAAPFGGDSNAPDPAAATDRETGYSNQDYDQNGLSPRGARVSFAQGRGYAAAPAQQRQPSIGSAGAGRAPNQWYPGGATANNKKKRPPKKDKQQQPGQSVLARVGAQPWSFDSNRS